MYFLLDNALFMLKAGQVSRWQAVAGLNQWGKIG
jgi:hypothetical protein